MLQSLWQRVKQWGNPPQPASKKETEGKPLPIAERCRILYSTLDLSPFMNYRQSAGHGKTITVAHETIDACIADITHHIMELSKVGFIENTGRQYNHFQKPINRFFTTKEGHYLPSVYLTLQELSTVTLDLLNHLDRTKETDYHSYNLRMLNALLFALFDLGTALVEVAAGINYRS